MHVNPERLRAAWERARRGSKAAGIDGITPDLFAGVAEEQLNQLARLLAQERYCPQPTLGSPSASAAAGSACWASPPSRTGLCSAGYCAPSTRHWKRR